MGNCMTANTASTEEAFCKACKRGDLEMMKGIAEHREPSQFLEYHRPKNGETALHIAVRNHHRAIVKWLIDSHCALDAVDFERKRAINLAVEQHDVVLVKLILEHSPKFGRNDAIVHSLFWNTPQVFTKNAIETLELLLQHGANINSLNARQQTVLDRIIFDPDKPDARPAVMQLLNHGANSKPALKRIEMHLPDLSFSDTPYYMKYIALMSLWGAVFVDEISPRSQPFVMPVWGWDSIDLVVTKITETLGYPPGSFQIFLDDQPITKHSGESPFAILEAHQNNIFHLRKNPAYHQDVLRTKEPIIHAIDIKRYAVFQLRLKDENLYFWQQVSPFQTIRALVAQVIGIGVHCEFELLWKDKPLHFNSMLAECGWVGQDWFVVNPRSQDSGSVAIDKRLSLTEKQARTLVFNAGVTMGLSFKYMDPSSKKVYKMLISKIVSRQSTAPLVGLDTSEAFDQPDRVQVIRENQVREKHENLTFQKIQQRKENLIQTLSKLQHEMSQ